jgi:hypothetical protein
VPASVILAHQGGWDEILLVAAPILVIVGLLTLAKRRVDANAPDSDSRDDSPAAPVDD